MLHRGDLLRMNRHITKKIGFGIFNFPSIEGEKLLVSGFYPIPSDFASFNCAMAGPREG